MLRRALMIVAALVVLSSTSLAEAQEIMLEGPLAGAPACRNCTLYRQGRFTIAPLFSFTLLDDYRRHIFIGGRLQYNITDWLGIGITGAAGGFWGDLLDTGLTEQVAEKAPNGIESNRTNYPFAANADGAESARAHTTDLLGRILGYLSVDLYFVPFRGKLGLFSRLFVDVDLYIFAGYAIPFVDERANVDCRSWDDMTRRAGGQAPEGVNEGNWSDYHEANCPWIGSEDEVPRNGTRVAVGAGTYGLGVSLYANNWLSVFLEYRVMPFLWNHTGTDERGMALVNDTLNYCPSDEGVSGAESCGDTGEFPDHRINESDRTWTTNHQFSLGVVFHFPLTPRRSQ